MYRFDSGAIARHQLTSDGFLRVYARLAKADHDLTYRNPFGETRIEICSERELFNKDSLDTFMMSPITKEHPPVKVDPSNYRDYNRGASGQTFIREVTPIGTFLGTLITIHDGELRDAVLSREIPGISPAYGVKPRLRTDGRYEQFNRKGNHIAVVKNPRGGSDIQTVLEGLRVDSYDADSDLWVQECDSEIYRIDMQDWISPLLTGEKQVSGLLENTPIILNKASSKQDSKKDKDDDGELNLNRKNSQNICDSESDCDCDRCSKKKRMKRRMKNPYSVDSSDSNGANNRAMETTTITVNGVPLEMPTAHAAIIQQALTSRTDSADNSEELDKFRQDNSDLMARNRELEAENTELRDTVQKFIDLADKMEDEDEFETDSADSDDDDEDEDNPLSFESIDELTEFVADSVDHYLTLESDAKLVGLEFGSNRKDAIAACLLETEAVQRQILSEARPGFNADSYDSDALNGVYEFAMEEFRQRASQESRQEQRADSVDFVSPLKAIGSLAATSSANGEGNGLKRYYEMQDAAFIGNKKK